jgi:hypothetical protein
MKVLKKAVWCILASAILTACGGGGGDTNSNTGANVNTESATWDNAQWDKATWK